MNEIFLTIRSKVYSYLNRIGTLRIINGRWTLRIGDKIYDTETGLDNLLNVVSDSRRNKRLVLNDIAVCTNNECPLRGCCERYVTEHYDASHGNFIYGTEDRHCFILRKELH